MPGVLITDKGCVTTKKIGDMQVSLPLVLSSTLNTTTQFTASGQIKVEQGLMVNRVSGTFSNSGFLTIGKTAPTASNAGVLLEISGSPGEGRRCAILLHATGNSFQNDAQSGGTIGFESRTPPPGSIYLYTDGSRLWLKGQNGAAFVAVTGTV